MRVTITLDDVETNNFNAARVSPLLRHMRGTAVVKGFFLEGMRHFASQGLVSVGQPELVSVSLSGPAANAKERGGWGSYLRARKARSERKEKRGAKGKRK
jgi:hypothetical protein